MSKSETAEPKKRTRRTTTDDNKVKKGGKKKAAKDPNAPKRGLTAYLFFANEQRDQVKAANPDLNFAQLNSLLGVKWKESTPEQKAPYEQKARDDKERYEKQKAEYESKKNQPSPEKDEKKEEDEEDEDDE